MLSDPNRPAPMVGPNSVTQLAAALRAHGGEPAVEATFAAAGLAPLLRDPPAHMIDERVPARLHRTLQALLPPPVGPAIAADAGTRTADYLLAHRIPKLAQSLLRRLPKRLAARLLLAAIGRNAWTFAGSGRFSGRAGDPLVIEIERNPLSTPGNPWHAATFRRLFRALVSPVAQVRVTACCADGAPACRFEIDLHPPDPVMDR
jgi:divinyl protochlorophyllide a 8-vinyl-reductase